MLPGFFRAFYGTSPSTTHSTRFFPRRADSSLQNDKQAKKKMEEMKEGPRGATHTSVPKSHPISALNAGRSRSSPVPKQYFRHWPVS